MNDAPESFGGSSLLTVADQSVIAVVYFADYAWLRLARLNAAPEQFKEEYRQARAFLTGHIEWAEEVINRGGTN